MPLKADTLASLVILVWDHWALYYQYPKESYGFLSTIIYIRLNLHL